MLRLTWSCVPPRFSLKADLVIVDALQHVLVQVVHDPGVGLGFRVSPLELRAEGLLVVGSVWGFRGECAYRSEGPPYCGPLYADLRIWRTPSFFPSLGVLNGSAEALKPRAPKPETPNPKPEALSPK